MKFSELILKHAGCIAVVIGGRPFTEEDGKALEAVVKSAKKNQEVITIGANEHASVAGIAVDYVVAMDDVHGEDNTPMMDRIRQHTDAPVIGPFEFNDYQLSTWPMAPRRVYTGTTAIWVGWALGASLVVVLCSDGYADVDGVIRPGYGEKVQAVVESVKCPVRHVNGGPLQEFFPAWDPKEKLPKFEPHPSLESLRGANGQITVKARKTTGLGGAPFYKGRTRQVMREDREVQRLLRHKMIEEVFEE